MLGGIFIGYNREEQKTLGSRIMGNSSENAIQGENKSCVRVGGRVKSSKHDSEAWKLHLSGSLHDALSNHQPSLSRHSPQKWHLLPWIPMYHVYSSLMICLPSFISSPLRAACMSEWLWKSPWQSHSDAHLLLFHFSTLVNIVKGGSREWTLHNQQSQRTFPPGAGGKHGLPQPTVLIAWPCGQLSLLTRKWHDAGRSCRIEKGIILEMHGQEL